MRLEEFDFDLPPSLIAQYPTPQRGDSRLMVLDRTTGTLEHRSFQNIIEYLHPGDLLVMNNTRVLPARLIGKMDPDKMCEVLLIPSQEAPDGEWEALVKNAKKLKLKPGTRIEFGENFYGEVGEVRNGRVKIRFPADGKILGRLREFGHIPLPPYIRRSDEALDRDRYQTVFADPEGSIASPTAGLHFTHGLLKSIRTRGVNTALITLHVGMGTFTPVRSSQIEDHDMEAEWIDIPTEVANQMEETKGRKGRVIAVGTTTTRALESAADPQGRIKSGRYLTRLYIYPSYRFRVLDGLITNFHLPKSTLIMLVSAFAGKELILQAYRKAVENKYRFYSYGDAMVIL
jgi:S-adenosylmethionine:tRNA ribosyltransferase-isomerase